MIKRPHPIPDEALEADIAILGKKGRGKTIVAKGIVERLLEAKRRVCVLDPMGVWWGLKSSADGQKPGFPVAVFGGAHADIPIGRDSGKKLAQVLGREHIPAVIDVSELRKGDMIHFATDFLDELYRVNRTALTLVLEEADVFAPQNPMAETARLLHEVDRIARRGRAFGFRLVTLTQRPARLHKDVLSQAGTLVALGVSSPQDRDAIKAWVEGNADRDKAKEVFASLAQLGVGEGWVWVPDLELLERGRFPMIKTLDTSFTPKAGEKRIEPKKLAQADIAKLTTLLQPEPPKDKPAQAPAAKPMTTSVEARQAAAERERAAEATGFRKGWEAARKAIGTKLATVARSAGKDIAEHLSSWMQQLQGAANEPLAQYAPPPIKPTAAPAPAKPAHHPHANGHAPETGEVSKPQQRILDVLAFMQSIGVMSLRKGTVAVLAEASPKSSAYENNLGRLRTLGHVSYPAGGMVALTESGIAIATPADRPPDLASLHEAIRRRLSGPQGRILSLAIDAYPNTLDKAELAAAVDASFKSSAYENNLGRLRSLGFIDYVEGRVQATSILFPEGLT